MSALERLSLGYAADRLARAIGWSPLAKSVVIYDAEGPSARLIEGIVGTVQSVEGGVMTLRTDRLPRRHWDEGLEIRLTVRHKGWTPFSLRFQPIAVVVELVRSDGAQDCVAVAMAAVLRRRDLVP